MLDELEPVVRHAIMSILSTLYESGIVEEVNMVDVLRLFGAEPVGTPNDEDVVFSFDDPGWVEAYIDFRKHENELMERLEDAIFDDAIIEELDAEDIEAFDPDLNPNRKLH
jgi:hypothetical protein